MTTSLIVNTCCLGPKARETSNSQGRLKHSQREYALRTWILPDYVRDRHVDELIVAGEFEPPPTDEFRYVHSPSTHFTCVDALAQRQAGFDVSSGDVVIVQHDDHWLDPASRLQFSDGWPSHFAAYDVVVPARWTRLRILSGERLNNGEAWKPLRGFEGVAQEPQTPYVSGHCAVFRRQVLVDVPWGRVPKVHTWDEKFTEQLLAAGVRILWTDSLRVYDVEFGSRPWE